MKVSREFQVFERLAEVLNALNRTNSATAAAMVFANFGVSAEFARIYADVVNEIPEAREPYWVRWLGILNTLSETHGIKAVTRSNPSEVDRYHKIKRFEVFEK